jgi:hypothetical protein
MQIYSTVLLKYFRKSFRVNGMRGLLGALVVSDATGWLQMRLRGLESKHLMPESMMPRLCGSPKHALLL